MADFGDTKTLKSLGVANNKLLDLRGGYNAMNNEPDSQVAWGLRNRCLELINELLALNDNLSHRCHEISRAKMEETQDPADDLFFEDDDETVAQARLEGAQDFGKGLTENDCRYESDDALADHWLEGYREAKADYDGEQPHQEA